ncbi:hypothetical protein TanjilG_20847 [Lupinus angustifolius]|uniref:Uncharacterized protein n=2 Tax=Lupinus angustifolius TaxID=3871 RepID=A0A4P1QS12_LUPAN|nr:PREDICTED: uncharacterized protein LOC109332306 isoform X1 [Lupinus angustifolius]OIV93185.1 hypothetical protein TanjilG_20847 [Lupinus angustifolius]
MVVEHDNNNNGVWSPIGSPLNREEHQQQQQRWSNFESSVNSVSFGFVATAILISMFLAMAIFERFIRPSSTPASSGRRRTVDVESQMGFNGKLSYPSPKMSVYANEVSVLMPGDEIPTFIAHPAPAPCCPERISWPSHQHNTLPCSTSNTLHNNNSIN